MRQILMTVLLIGAVVSVYTAAVQGEGGMKTHLRDAGVSMAEAIARISP